MIHRKIFLPSFLIRLTVCPGRLEIELNPVPEFAEPEAEYFSVLPCSSTCDYKGQNMCWALIFMISNTLRASWLLLFRPCCAHECLRSLI